MTFLIHFSISPLLLLNIFKQNFLEKNSKQRFIGLIIFNKYIETTLVRIVTMITLLLYTLR